MEQNKPNEVRAGRSVRGAIAVAIAIAFISMFLMGGAAPAHAEGTTTRPRPNIVLVHGAWADGSSFSGVTSRLQADGYTVHVLPNPLADLRLMRPTLPAT